MFGAVVLAAVVTVSLAAPQEVDSILLQQDNNPALPQEPVAESQIEEILSQHRERLRHGHEAKINNEWHHAVPRHRPSISHHNIHEVEKLKHLAQQAFLLAEVEKKKHEEHHRHHDHHKIEASRIIDDHNKHNPYFIEEVLRKANEHHEPHHEHRQHHEHKPHHEHRHRDHENHEIVRLLEHPGQHDRLPIDNHHDRRVHPHHEYLHIYDQPVAIFRGKANAYLPYTERPLLHYEELPYHRNNHHGHERHH